MDRTIEDHLGTKVIVPKFPQRIISLVPSQTELLFDLGVGDRLVGLTKFCIHPNEWYIKKSRVGGTKSLDIAKIKLLKPDLVIGNKEENTLADIQQIQEIAPVWVSDINKLPDALMMIRDIGNIVNCVDRASIISNAIEKSFETFNSQVSGKSVLYLIWKGPYMGVATNTFIHDILENCLELRNVLSKHNRYPIINLSEIQSTPDYVFLSSEPFPFSVQHEKEIQKIFPTSKVLRVNGEYFSWYGSRLLQSVNYFKKLNQVLKA